MTPDKPEPINGPLDIIDPEPWAPVVDARGLPLSGDLVRRQLSPYGAMMPASMFDLTTRAGKIGAFNAQSSSVMTLEEAEGAEIDIVGYHLFEGSMGSEDPRPILRFVLIDPAGESYGGASEGVVRSLVGIVRLFGPPPWAPPIKVVMQKCVNSATKRTYHTLIIVG